MTWPVVGPPGGADVFDRLARLETDAFRRPRQTWRAVDLSDVAARAGGIVLCDPACDGMIAVQVAGPEAEILTIAVRSTARRTGLGSALLSAACREAGRIGAQDLFLEVADDNVAARAFYARHGFAERGRRPGYYHRPEGPRVDALILSRSL